MVNLFKDTRIVTLNNDNSIIIEVNLDNEQDILIDWNDCSYSNVTINFKGNTTYKVVEINQSSERNVIINVDEYTNVYHSIASFDVTEKVNYEVNLYDESFYQGAYADFSKGVKNMNFVCNLHKPYAKALWNLASLSTNDDKKTFYVSFYHYAPHTYAKMENYGVSEDESSLNFFGTSSIEKGAKASATHQSAKIMVFDEKCKCKASPILCIDENDVEASHAAVVGQINEEHIFYLTSRGIKEDEAKKLITLGYLNPILNFFEDKSILDQIHQNLEGRF